MDEHPLPAELERLTGPEKKYAVPVYLKWMAIFAAERPDQDTDNQRRALNGAYATAGRYWLGPAALCGLPGGIVLSVWRSPVGVILLCGTGVFICLGLWRFIQALRFFPHLSMRRVRLSAKHPNPYE